MSIAVPCSVANCGAKREKQGYCLSHYLQYKDTSPSTASARATAVFNPYSEFREFTRKEIQDYMKKFKLYDVNGDGEIDLLELKYMMEKLNHPQTHVGLKAILKEVDEDLSGGICLREFLLVFRKAKTGSLQCEGLVALAKEINVAEEGVGGAKTFFEAHANKFEAEKKNEMEIKQEQAEKKAEREAAAERRVAFKQTASMWK